MLALGLHARACRLSLQYLDCGFDLVNDIFLEVSAAARCDDFIATYKRIEFACVPKRRRRKERRIMLFRNFENLFARSVVGRERFVYVRAFAVRQHFFGIPQVRFGV